MNENIRMCDEGEPNTFTILQKRGVDKWDWLCQIRWNGEMSTLKQAVLTDDVMSSLGAFFGYCTRSKPLIVPVWAIVVWVVSLLGAFAIGHLWSTYTICMENKLFASDFSISQCDLFY